MRTEDFVLRNRNQKRIQGTVRIPDRDAKGTVILLHGLGGWKDQPLLVTVATALCNDSYVVVTFNAADGTMGPDGNFFNQTTTGYLYDLEDIFSFVTESAWQRGKIILAGHSMGALVALTYARRHPESQEKLILMAPAVSWKMMWWAQIPWSIPWLLWGKRKWSAGPAQVNRMLSRNWIFDFMRYDGYADAKHISIPTLLIAAQNDKTVAKPSEVARLKRNFTDSKLVTISGTGHVFYKREQQVADTIIQWLSY